MRFGNPESEISLKDKSGVGKVLAYSRNYTVLNGVYYFFFNFFSLLICEATYFNLPQSAK